MKGEEYNIFLREHRNRVGRPADPNMNYETEGEGSMKLCKKCLSELSPGKQHSCVKTTKRENLIELVQNMSPKTKSALLVTELKAQAVEQGQSVKGRQINLQSGSCQLPITVGQSSKTSDKQFSHQDLIRLGTRLNLSNNSLM